jgi:DNA mismatch repair protein MutS
VLAAVARRGSCGRRSTGVSLTGRAAAALALRYARATQPGLRPFRCSGVSRLDPRDHLHVDDTTQGHLELFRSVRGDKKGTLLAHLDRTVTPMGARRLRTWLAFPLQDVKRIRRRHDAVDALVTYPDLRGPCARALKRMLSDIERIAVRAQPRGRHAARPRIAARRARPRARRRSPPCAAQPDAAEALGPLRDLDPCPELLAVLQGSLADSPPWQLDDGGRVSRGLRPRARSLQRAGHQRARA